MYAHIYCPNFLVQCEQVFRPELRQQAFVIHDYVKHSGSVTYQSIVAVSAKAELLGYTLDLEANEALDEKNTLKIIKCRGNRALYRDFSERLMTSLELLAPKINTIAENEVWIDLDKLKTDKCWRDYALELQESIQQWLGLEIFVGLGNTRTLASVACRAAKQNCKTDLHAPKILVLDDKPMTEIALKDIAVSNIQGVSPKSAIKLSELGIHSALELSKSPKYQIGRRCSVVLEHIAIELSGLESNLLSSTSRSSADSSPVRKSLLRNVSEDGHAVNEVSPEYLITATGKASLASFKKHLNIVLESAFEELNSLQLTCQRIQLSLIKQNHNNDLSDIEGASISEFDDTFSIELNGATNSFSELKSFCRQLLESLFQQHRAYQGMALVLGNLALYSNTQGQLFASKADTDDTGDKASTITALKSDAKTPIAVPPVADLEVRRNLIFEAEKSDADLVKPKVRAPISPSFTSEWHELLRVN